MADKRQTNRGSIKKGEVRNPRGRGKGTPNKTTKEIREAVKQLVENTLPDLKKWLYKVAEDDPYKALQIVERYMDYVVPKLQRTEISGGDDTPLKKVIFDFGTENNRDNTDEETNGNNTGDTK